MPQPPEVLEERRNSLINTLSEQYARNQFSLEEYERMVEYTQKIETSREIAMVGRLLQEYNTTGRESGGETPSGFLNRHLTILSSRRIEGFPPDEQNRDFVAILGDCRIFISEADLVQEETVLHVTVLLGEVIIHVPENVTVINRALPLLGDVGIKNKKKKNAPSPWNKKLIITGTAILGNITVTYR